MIGDGKLPEQQADQVLLLRDPALELDNGRARAEHELLRFADVEERGDAAALAHLRQLQRILARGQRALRDLELQIERAQLEVGVGDVADDRRQHGAPAPFGREQLRPRGLRWRAGSGPRNPAPSRRSRRREWRRPSRPASCRLRRASAAARLHLAPTVGY